MPTRVEVTSWIDALTAMHETLKSEDAPRFESELRELAGARDALKAIGREIDAETARARRGLGARPRYSRIT